MKNKQQKKTRRRKILQEGPEWYEELAKQLGEKVGSLPYVFPIRK